jgi:hypothetical protein
MAQTTACRSPMRVFTLCMVFLSSAYELALVKSFSNVDERHGPMCLTEFPISNRPMWIFIHQFVFVTHLLIPLLINIGCTGTITSIVIKTKMRLRGQKECKSLPPDQIRSCIPNQRRQMLYNALFVSANAEEIRNRRDVLRDVLNENKEMLARPAITLLPSIFSLFTLPLFVIGFSFECHNLENNSLRYLLISCYFITFIPQMVTFLLYIYPSSFYWKQWQTTTISKWIATFRHQHAPIDLTIFSTIREQPTRACSHPPKKDE